jgi:hypothetical protein
MRRERAIEEREEASRELTVRPSVSCYSDRKDWCLGVCVRIALRRRSLFPTIGEDGGVSWRLREAEDNCGRVHSARRDSGQWTVDRRSHQLLATALQGTNPSPAIQEPHRPLATHCWRPGCCRSVERTVEANVGHLASADCGPFGTVRAHVQCCSEPMRGPGAEPREWNPMMPHARRLGRP